MCTCMGKGSANEFFVVSRDTRARLDLRWVRLGEREERGDGRGLFFVFLVLGAGGLMIWCARRLKFGCLSETIYQCVRLRDIRKFKLCSDISICKDVFDDRSSSCGKSKDYTLYCRVEWSPLYTRVNASD